jgi:hypothetical protein
LKFRPKKEDPAAANCEKKTNFMDNLEILTMTIGIHLRFRNQVLKTLGIARFDFRN